MTEDYEPTEDDFIGGEDAHLEMAYEDRYYIESDNE